MRSETVLVDSATPKWHADRVINNLAAEQHGIVTRAQLIRAGVSRHMVDRRVLRGQLVSMHAGVYRVGPVIAVRAREMAAVFACDGGVISHWSAGAVRGITPPQRARDPVDITIGRSQHCGRRPGLRPHRYDVAEDEVERVDSVPVTSAARTVLDLAGVAAIRELEKALSCADRVDSNFSGKLTNLLQRYPRRAGAARLRELVGQGTNTFTRSEAEERLLNLIRRGGLPAPELNVVVCGYEVDCYWRRAGLVIEVDGYAFHGSARAFVRDRQRDMALAAAGIQVLRITWHQLVNEPEKTLVQITQALAHAGLLA